MADINISTPYDALGLSESGTIHRSGPISVTESVTPALYDHTLEWTAPAETLTVTDSATGDLTPDVRTTVFDPITVTSGGATIISGPIHIAEDVQLSFDTIEEPLVSTSVDDTLTLSEGGETHRVGPITISEDVQTAFINATPGLSIDTVGVVDAAPTIIISSRGNITISRGDDIGITEVLEFGEDRPIRVTEAVTPVIVDFAIRQSVFDPITVTDVLNDVVFYDYTTDVPTQGDDVAINDVVTQVTISNFDYPGEAHDDITVSDVADPHIPQYAYTYSDDDTLTVSDVPTGFIEAFNKSVLVFDPVTLSDGESHRLTPDIIAATAHDSLTIGEDVALTSANLGVEVYDTLSVTDAITEAGLDQTLILSLIARRDTTFELSAKVPYVQGSSVWRLDISRLNVNTTLV